MHRHSVYLLTLGVALLVTLGLIMLFSTGAYAHDAHGNPSFFIRKQIVWLGIGLVICVIAARVDYHLWGKVWWALYGLATVLLVLCYVRPIGQKINGSWRWVNLHYTTFQPSELGKLAALVALAWWFARDEKGALELRRGFLYPLLLSGFLMALIVREVDLGTTSLLGATTLGVMFVAGTRLYLLIPMVFCSLAGLSLVVWRMPESDAPLSGLPLP